MFSILLVLLIIVAVFMIGIILLQKSEGSGMSGSSAAAMFGGALTGAAAGNFLTKLTAWLAVVFFVLEECVCVNKVGFCGVNRRRVVVDEVDDSCRAVAVV